MDREESAPAPQPLPDPRRGPARLPAGIACKLAAEHCPDVRVLPGAHPVLQRQHGAERHAAGLERPLLRARTRRSSRRCSATRSATTCSATARPPARCEVAQRIRHFLGRVRRRRPASVSWRRSLGLRLHPRAGTRSRCIGLTLMRDAGYDPRERARSGTTCWPRRRPRRAAMPPSGTRCSPPIRRPRSAAARSPGWPKAPTGGFVGEAEYAAEARRRCASACSRTRSSAASRRDRWSCSTAWSSDARARRTALLPRRGPAAARPRQRPRRGDRRPAPGDRPRQPSRPGASLARLHPSERAQPAEASAEFARYIELCPTPPMPD